MWKVLVSERSYKDLEKALKGLPDDEVRSILQKLDELAEELHITPYPAHRFNLRKVVGIDHVEIHVRLGKFRAIYRVYKKRKEIVLLAFFRGDESSYRRL